MAARVPSIDRTPITNGRREATRPRSPGRPPWPAELLSALSGLADYAGDQTAVGKARLRLALSRKVTGAVTAIALGLVGGIAVAICIAVLLIGCAGGIAAAMEQPPWVGQIVLAGGILALVALGAFVFSRKRRRRQARELEALLRERELLVGSHDGLGAEGLLERAEESVRGKRERSLSRLGRFAATPTGIVSLSVSALALGLLARRKPAVMRWAGRQLWKQARRR